MTTKQVWRDRLAQVRRFIHGDPLVHCWEDGPGEDSSTCMRLDGHFGKHVFTPDSNIEVAFPAEAGN